MNRLCTICARKGSKGVKNKNIRTLLDRPLIAHSIEQAKRAGLFSAIAVSSDSDEILLIAKQWGADYLIQRPMALATDEAPKLPAIVHCVNEVERLTNTRFDTIVDLDPTSPLRTVEDIVAATRLLEDSRVSNVITGMPARRSPYFNLVEVNDSGVVQLSKTLPNRVTRRQDSPPCYDMNASIYVWERDALLGNTTSVFNNDTKIYVMPEERSIDIDNELDFAIVQLLAEKRGTLL